MSLACERVVPWKCWAVLSADPRAAKGSCRGSAADNHSPSPRHSQSELQNECPNAHSGAKLQRRSPKETSRQDGMGVLMGWWGWVMTVTQVAGGWLLAACCCRLLHAAFYLLKPCFYYCC